MTLRNGRLKVGDNGHDLSDRTQHANLLDGICGENGNGWIVLDTQTGQVFDTGEYNKYALTTTDAYNRYRLRITKNRMHCPSSSTTCGLGDAKTKATVTISEVKLNSDDAQTTMPFVDVVGTIYNSQGATTPHERATGPGQGQSSTKKGPMQVPKTRGWHQWGGFQVSTRYIRLTIIGTHGFQLGKAGSRGSASGSAGQRGGAAGVGYHRPRTVGQVTEYNRAKYANEVPREGQSSMRLNEVVFMH